MTKQTEEGLDLQLDQGVADRVIVLPDVLELRRDQAAAAEAAEATAERSTRTHLWLLITVCLLNSIDALLTHLVVTQGLATEWNPVVASMGLVPKLILVPLAAEALYLLKPKALWIPAVALFGVIVYTSLGFALAV
jgi:hypothetical protein